MCYDEIRTQYAGWFLAYSIAFGNFKPKVKEWRITGTNLVSPASAFYGLKIEHTRLRTIATDDTSVMSF
jgi:hypothetical protein